MDRDDLTGLLCLSGLAVMRECVGMCRIQCVCVCVVDWAILTSPEVILFNTEHELFFFF